MPHIFFSLFMFNFGVYYPVNSNQLLQEHMKIKDMMINHELGMMLGNDIILSSKEKQVNDIIMKLKHKIIDDGLENPNSYIFSKHFFQYRDEIKNYSLYQILNKMPKGALLHGHDTGMLGANSIMNITYWDDLYMCNEGGKTKFIFSLAKPSMVTCSGRDWNLINNQRFASKNIEMFDNELRKLFTVVSDNNTNMASEKIDQFLQQTAPILTYKPAREFYFYETLKRLREENIMYVEIRTLLPELYDLQNHKYSARETAESYKKILDEFMKDHPDFYGAKIIYVPMKSIDLKSFGHFIEDAKKINLTIPGLLAGLGFMDRDLLRLDLLSIITNLSDDFEYFIHAGETKSYGTLADEDLADAIILDCSRLGPAFALSKHPHLMDQIVAKNIGLEVSVISNNIFGLVTDVRNHPLATYLARNLPVVLTSDNSGIWGADFLTHELFVCFVAVASNRADLRLLKRLILNSLYYSTHPEIYKLVDEFHKRWDIFLDETLATYTEISIT